MLINNISVTKMGGKQEVRRIVGWRWHLDGCRLLGASVNVLQLARVRDLKAGLVLGQDLHERPQFQPPLLFGNSVPADERWQG